MNEEINDEIDIDVDPRPQEADVGDLVVIYTKLGKNKTIKNKSGNNTHFFYWGLGKTVWNKSGAAAAAVVLFSLNDWAFKKT